MAAATPFVRFMVLCEDIRYDKKNSQRVTLENLLTNIQVVEAIPFPHTMRELCIYVQMTECQGKLNMTVRVWHPDTWQVIYEANLPEQKFATDPLSVHGQPIRLRDLTFPNPGLYEVEFEVNGEVLDSQPLRLR